MAEKKAAKCAHPGCNCPAAKDSKYGPFGKIEAERISEQDLR